MACPSARTKSPSLRPSSMLWLCPLPNRCSNDSRGSGSPNMKNVKAYRIRRARLCSSAVGAVSRLGEDGPSWPRHRRATPAAGRDERRNRRRTAAAGTRDLQRRNGRRGRDRSADARGLAHLLSTARRDSEIQSRYAGVPYSLTNAGEKSTPRPGPSGTHISARLSFQPPLKMSLYSEVFVLPCSMIRQSAIDVHKCSVAAVHTGPFGLCGATFT